MKRGVLLTVLAVAATLPVRVAPAAEQQFAVYEITRARAGGPSTVPVFVYVDSDGSARTLSLLQLAPRKGGGWNAAGIRVLQFNSSDSEFAVYGPEAGPLPVPCPPDDSFCGKKGAESFYAWVPSFRAVAGNRYFVAVPTKDAWVFTTTHWRARKVSLGARQVTAENTSSFGVVADEHKREVFQSATLGGGAYGSAVYGQVPCEIGDHAGSATLKSDGSDAAVDITCAPDDDFGFSQTHDGRTWTLNGPVVGEYEWPLRMFVFDYPKR